MLFMKLQGGHQRPPFLKTADTKNQNRWPARQTRGSKVEVIASSNMGTTSIVQESEAEPTVRAIVTASIMTSPSSSSLSIYSLTQMLTNLFDSCGVCFKMRYCTPNCTLILNKDKKRLMYRMGINLRGLQPWEAATHGEPPPYFSGAIWEQCSPRRDNPSSQTAKQSGVGKHPHWRIFMKK